MKNRIVRSLLFLSLVVVADQVTKILAKKLLMGKGIISHVNDIWRWVYAENKGAFLSWGSELSGWMHFVLLKGLPILLLLGLLLYTLFSKEVLKKQVIPLSLILGGGISNLFDRLAYGKVVDFMNVGIGNLRTGIFNIADMAILTGIIWLLFVQGKKKEVQAEETKTDTTELENQSSNS